MWYYCLRCRRPMKGLGVQPHISYKHGRMAMKPEPKQLCLERLSWGNTHHNPKENDYFLDGQLAVVCIGTQDPKWIPYQRLKSLLADAEKYWQQKLPKKSEACCAFACLKETCDFNCPRFLKEMGVDDNE